MARHTPGSWHVYHPHLSSTQYHVQSGIGRIASCQPVRPYRDYPGGLDEQRAEVHANARLITAAPDLLAACQALIASYDRALAYSELCGLRKVGDEIAAVRAAIARASGQDVTP